jgi:serine/threonine protein kinase
MKPTARRRLGKYVLLGRLGAGGMGKIYLAHAPGPAGIDKLLVVKRLHSHLTNDPVLVNSFLDEARLSMALNHQNIVHTYDVGEVDGRYFMVMEYIDGQNMGVVLRTAKRSGQYPKSTVWAGLFLSVLDGLHAAHTARDARGRPLQIIHRDVSPQNILITYEGLPKLVDFGIAKAAMRVSETDAGTLKGKYAYMSPEQVRGDELDPRSDVFAAGIVLWEMLAGRRLYKAETIIRSVERILNEPLISPVRVNPSCDPGLAAVALKALQKNRNDRYASAEEFRSALEDALEATGTRFRAIEGKDLMQRLFADVIDKQRAVLEATLTKAYDGPDDDDDDGRRSSDSQSDLRMPQLGLPPVNESTTPSAARRSPLVTAEGDGVPPPPSRAHATRGDRRPPAATASTGPVSPSPSSSAPAPASLLLAPPLDSGSAAFLADTDAVTMTGAGHEDAPPRRTIWVPLLAACVGVLVAVVGVGVVRSLGSSSSSSSSSTATPRPLPSLAPVVLAPPPPSPPPIAVEPPVSPPVEVPPVVAVVEPTTEPAIDIQAPDPPSSLHKGQKKPPRRPPPPPPAQSELRPDPPPPTTTDAVAEQGFLTLDTVPWTTVYLGKRKLGETPLIKVPVPSGALELSLINSEEGVKESYLAKVKPGEVFRTRLDLR